MDDSQASREPDPVAVVRAWWNAAGPALAHVAALRGYEDGRLELAVPNRTWLLEVESRLGELTKRLRREPCMDGLRDVFVVLDPACESPKRVLPSRPDRSDSLEPPAEILAAARAIPDRDLARRWTAAVGRLLAVSLRDRPGR